MAGKGWPALLSLAVLWTVAVLTAHAFSATAAGAAAAPASSFSRHAPGTVGTRTSPSPPPPPPPRPGSHGQRRQETVPPPPPPPPPASVTASSAPVTALAPDDIAVVGGDGRDGQGVLLRFTPPSLDFRRQPVCIASVRDVELTHMGAPGDLPVSLTAVRPWSSEAGVIGRVPSPGNLADAVDEGMHFLTSTFEPVTLHPGNSTTLQVILLPRAIGAIEGTLMVESSTGFVISYPLLAEGVGNPYNLQPVVARLPVGASLTRSITLYNPHRDVLHVKELFTTDRFLHLSLPDPPQQHGTRLADAAAAGSDASVGDDVDVWKIPPHSHSDIITVKFQSHKAGKYDGYVHVKTSHNDMVLPVVISVLRGGLLSSPMSLDMGAVAVAASAAIHSPKSARAAGGWQSPSVHHAVSQPGPLKASITLSNTGASPVRIVAARLSKPHPRLSLWSKPVRPPACMLVVRAR